MESQDALLQALTALGQQSGVAQFMNQLWVWPIAESLHFLGLSLLIGTVGLFDLRLLGVAKQIPIAALHRLVPYGVLGYVLNLVTGLLFFLTAPGEYLYNPAFQTKLAFMLVAGLNMLLFYRLVFGALKTSMPEPGFRSAKLMTGISLLCWIGVITCGRLITFYRPPFFWCWWCGG